MQRQMTQKSSVQAEYSASSTQHDMAPMLQQTLAMREAEQAKLTGQAIYAVTLCK